jgi:hypothetical protein
MFCDTVSTRFLLTPVLLRMERLLIPDCSGFELWNITYVMPAGSSEIPSISLSIELGS